jgi:hypothetical protein
VLEQERGRRRGEDEYNPLEPAEGDSDVEESPHLCGSKDFLALENGGKEGEAFSSG